jgi:chemotaxis protein histidine kinase CheA
VLGATDLGDGRVVLIIDAAALARRAPAGFAGTQP